MNELEYILDVHRRQQRRFEAVMDAIVFLAIIACLLILRACDQ